MRLVLKYLTIAAAALVVTHLAASAALSVITSQLRDHRMINVRHLGSHPERRPDLIAAFLRSFVGSDKPKVLIAGSSFAWGYSWPEKDVFSWHLQRLRPDLDVINASVIGDSGDETAETLCLAGKIGVKFQAVLIEINLSNLTKTPDPEKPRRCDTVVSTSPALPGLAYFTFFATAPYGLSHLQIIRDEYNYGQPERKFSFGPLADSYFATRETFDGTIPQVEQLFASIAEAGAKLSDNVVVFFSPIATEGLRRSQFNTQEIERQLMVLHTLCERQPKLRCLPIENDLPLEYFGNLTHLNLAGHAFYGRYLSDVLDQPITAAAQKDAVAPVHSEPQPVRPAASMITK